MTLHAFINVAFTTILGTDRGGFRGGPGGPAGPGAFLSDTKIIYTSRALKWHRSDVSSFFC